MRSVSRSATGSRRGHSVRVALAILAVTVVLFLAMSIWSGLAGQDKPGTNWGGILGSYVAGWLRSGLGLMSAAVPVWLGVSALLLFPRKRRWRRCVAAGLVTLGLLAGFSLLTYQLGATGAVDNFGGWLGLQTARYAVKWLGFGAFALVVLLLFWGIVLWQRRGTRQDLMQTAFMLSLGLLFDLFAAYLQLPQIVAGGDVRSAGDLGKTVIVSLARLLGRPGSLAVLVAAALIVLVVFASMRLPEFGWLREALTGLRRSQPKPRTDPRVQKEVTPPAGEEKVDTLPAAARKQTTHDPTPRVVQPHAAKPVRFRLNEFQEEFLALLDQPEDTRVAFKDPEEAQQEANLLIEKLRQFGIDGRVVEIQSGPMITRFELEPAPGVKIQRIESLADDLSLALSAERIRILAPIPGKSAVGVEIPNKERRTVYLREVLVSEAYRQEKSPLGFALGTTITGEPYCGDLRMMPHMLIAGTTGSGKSVCINSLVMSIIYRSSPQEVRFLTIDPKQLELPVYNPIPHLLSSTTTDPKQAVDGLTRMVGIMEARYGEFANMGVRDIAAYNAVAEEQGLPRKPYIVVVIDELADLMLRAPNEIEERITRLAQMSRAVGIHLVLATQRPSVDVITGLIKANFPCRVAFQVASKTDSRTILDMNGAESLLGRGDMLFLPPGKGEPVRLHGAFVSDQAAQRIVRLWTREYFAGLLSGLVDDSKAKAAEIVDRGVADVFYDRERAGTKRGMEILRSLLPDEVIDNIMARPYHEPLPEERDVRVVRIEGESEGGRDIDDKFAEAARIVVRHREASVSMLQRRLDVGWARAGRIIDQLEQAGIVGPYVGSKSRRVLIENEAELEKILARVNTSCG